MGYRILYDNQLLFDPYTDDRITDTKLSSKLNAASYFDFSIAPTHYLYSKLEERAGEVRIYFNNLILFKGEITKIEEDFEGNYSVSCTGVLDYLTATRVRPYSTVEGEQPLKAPSSYDGYFQWLIDQHNSNCLDSRKHFSVGVNQGNMLDKNNYIYRSSEQRPTTASEIEDKILNSDGGYLFVRYQDDLNIIDLYADVHDVNTQIIDYGVNMLDFTKTTTTESQYTAVVATGYTPNPPEGQPDTKMKPITLEGCADGGTPYSSTIVKMGDRVYDVEAVKRYGYHEYYVSNTDITTYDGLLYYACKTLNTLLSPALTISVRAVDLALIMGDKYKHLQLGQAVRIRSKPRKVDEYLMVNSIDLDLMNPENTVFELGASYDTLTGQQSAYLKSLNSSINASLDIVDSLGDNVKNSAKLAQEAKEKAETATDAATDAATKAESAITKADKVKTDLDDLTIGGENLISNLAINWQSGGWVYDNNGMVIQQDTTTASLMQYVNVENADYCLSIQCRIDENITAYIIELDSENKFIHQAEFTKFPSVIRIYDSSVSKWAISIHSSNKSIPLDLIGSSDLKIKLEKGNRPTDWSPPSKDISQVASNDTAKVRTTVEELTTSIVKEYATKTQLEQTSTSITSRIQTTETTVAGMSTTVKNVDDYMTFARESGHPTLTIGSSSSSFRTKLTNTSEKFMQGDQTIMELDGVTSTVKASRVQMGHYQWRDTGTSMQLVYIP